MTKLPSESFATWVHPFSIGSREGWILSDGTYRFPAAALARGASAAELALLLGDDLSPDGQLEMSVNGMLLQWGDELILIDAGCGSAYGATLGRMEKSLHAAGFQPSDVTAVVFTHLHLDHLAGVIDASTQTVRFPRARLLARREEVAFWTQAEPDLAETGVPAEQSAAVIKGISDTLARLGKR